MKYQDEAMLNTQQADWLMRETSDIQGGALLAQSTGGQQMKGQAGLS